LSQGCGISSHPKGWGNEQTELIGFLFFFFFPPFFGTNENKFYCKKTHIGFIFFKGKFLYNFFFFLKQGVCCTVALPIYIKKYLKAKEELQKLKYFPMQNYNLPKIL
jgi:hypothetical protein